MFSARVPRAAYVRSPFQIFQNDRAVYIVYQDVHAYRVIYLNGSPHNEGLGYSMGDSRGHWRATRWYGCHQLQRCHLAGCRRRLSQRSCMWSSVIRARSPDTLSYEATIEDPKVFTRPWKIRMPLRLQKGIQIVEDECEEGENGRRYRVLLFKQVP